MGSKKIGYSEPANYFPKELRKKYKVGEYYQEPSRKLENPKKATPKKKSK